MNYFSQKIPTVLHCVWTWLNPFYWWMPPEPKAQTWVKTRDVYAEDKRQGTASVWNHFDRKHLWVARRHEDQEAFDGRGKFGLECLKDEVRTAVWMENTLWEGRETDLSYPIPVRMQIRTSWGKKWGQSCLGHWRCLRNQSRATRTVNLGKQVNTAGKGVR